MQQITKQTFAFVYHANGSTCIGVTIVNHYRKINASIFNKVCRFLINGATLQAGQPYVLFNGHSN